MNLAQVAADIARNVGREFPEPLVPWQEMTLRQLTSLAEECIELDEVIDSRNRQAIADELADASLTPYMVAHYAGIDLETTVAALADSAASAVPPYRYAGQALKCGRRYLGIARRSGTKEALAEALALTVLAVRGEARAEGVDLGSAIENKTNVIFSRGWRQDTAPRCGGCGYPITGRAWRHVRLHVHVHDDSGCLSNVRGEDVRKHCMELVNVPPAGEVTVGVPNPGL